MTVQVRFVQTHPSAKLPTRGTDGAAGWDLSAAMDAPIRIPPGQRRLIPTGFNVAVPDGYEAQVRSRSGLALKQGLFVLNSPGTIDPDYRGPLGVILFNSGLDAIDIKPGDRIAQLVIAPVIPAAMILVSAFDDTTSRGTNGYGSTGV